MLLKKKKKQVRSQIRFRSSRWSNPGLSVYPVSSCVRTRITHLQETWAMAECSPPYLAVEPHGMENHMWQLFNERDFGKCGFALRTNESKDKECIPYLALTLSDGFLWKGWLGHIFCKPRKLTNSVSYPQCRGNVSSCSYKRSHYSGITVHLGEVSATSEHFSFPWTGNSPIFCNKWALKMSFVNYSLESQILFWLRWGSLRLKSLWVFFIIQMLHSERALLS